MCFTKLRSARKIQVVVKLCAHERLGRKENEAPGSQVRSNRNSIRGTHKDLQHLQPCKQRTLLELPHTLADGLGARTL